MLTAGISVLLQFKRINSVMPVSAISQYGKPIGATNKKTGFQQEMQENYCAELSEVGVVMSS
jgi:hypothetical protein